MSIKKILQIFSLMYLLFLFIGFLLISKFDLLLYIAFFIPCVFWICWAKIKNESWDIPNKENRIIPLFFTLWYLVLLNLFWKSEFITIFLVNVLIILIITKFWKISMHNYGLSAMAYLIYAFTNNIWLSSLYLILIIITGYARIYLKKHTFSQVIAGTILGILVNYILLNLI
ncbi:phosphatase PAP2 family protein [Methanocaldococcus sp. 28A]